MLVPPLLTLLLSHLLPTRPARRPAPHASDTSPGVTPPSGPRLISVCIQPSPWARRSVGVAEHGGSRFLRPVPVRSPRRTSAPRAETPTLHPRPFRPLFFLLCCPVGRGTASPWDPADFPRSRTRLLCFPVPSSPPGATVGPASPIFTPRCPVLLSQLDAFSISLNVPSPVVRRTHPPDLACSWA